MKDRIDQIRQVHARFIHAVVQAVDDPDSRIELEQALAIAEENGWTDAVHAVRLILAGRRDSEMLSGLDEEDHAIISGILEGLQNPANMPDPAATADPSFAAPGLAGMIMLAARGDVQGLQAIALMAEQMNAAGGEMAQVAAKFRALINGERDADQLTARMSNRSRSLILSILEELGKLDAH
jgi:hypothetical protein